MKNITLAIDDKVLAKVRLIAAEKGTTVNALVRKHLADLAYDQENYEEARRGLLELIDKSPIEMPPGWKWNREELYDRAALRRHQYPDLRGDGEEAVPGEAQTRTGNSRE